MLYGVDLLLTQYYTCTYHNIQHLTELLECSIMETRRDSIQVYTCVCTIVILLTM